MLDHLDDPNPPEPSTLAVDRIMAEGGRRLRRRRVLAGSGIALASTLAVAGIAFAAVGPDRDTGDDVHTVDPAVDDPDTPTTTEPAEPPSGTTPSTVTTAPTTTTAGEPSGPGPGGAVVAVVVSEAGDRAQVARVDPGRGTVLDVLAEYELDGVPPLCCVTVSPDGEDVYYVASPGQSTGPDPIWHVPADGSGEPEQLTTGSYPTVSPDGSRLAFARDGTDPAVVVRDLAGGDEQVFPADIEDFLRDVAWADDDTVVVTRNALESATRAWTVPVPVGGPGRPLAEVAAPLGPPEGSPSGTGWEWVERRPDGLLDVIETCCSLDAGSYDGGAAHLVVDPATGAVVDRTPLADGGGGVAGVATGPAGETLILVPPAGDPGTGTLFRLADGGPVEVPGGLRVIAADW